MKRTLIVLNIVGFALFTVAAILGTLYAAINVSWLGAGIGALITPAVVLAGMLSHNALKEI